MGPFEQMVESIDLNEALKPGDVVMHRTTKAVGTVMSDTDLGFGVFWDESGTDSPFVAAENELKKLGRVRAGFKRFAREFKNILTVAGELGADLISDLSGV